ncbi:MAG TPA: cytochrome c [Gemmatimonadaceae bacterium]|nr:cytochrome c [Gemmatimonadaceae bacterium]
MDVARTAAAAIVALGIAGGSLLATRASSATHAARPAATRPLLTPHSVWDSVYTEEQARRGEAIYRETCSKCHGAELAGIDDALPLAGSGFLSNWNGLSVGDFVERIRQSMPPTDPGVLNRAQTVDVVAYVLFFNKFPAGNTELAREAEVLKQIRIEATRPQATPAGSTGGRYRVLSERVTKNP